MDKFTMQALDDVVNYLYDQEHKHWQEAGEPEKGHIFHDIKLLADYVDNQRECKSMAHDVDVAEHGHCLECQTR